MVLWCKRCEAFIGIREPITNWATDRSAVCTACLEKQFGKAATDFLNDTVEDRALPTEDAIPVSS